MILAFALALAAPQLEPGVVRVPVGPGWAATKVNAVPFRRSSITSHGGRQYTAYYDPEGFVVLARREHGSDDWTVRRTELRGNVRDAHNAISLIVDGAGVLHVAWDHHGHPLRYRRGAGPGSLELRASEPMIGRDEERVTYPEFYALDGGDLIFLYRDGASGNGDLVVNRYDTERATWTRLHDVLVDGEGERNAYWQACTDGRGGLHLSWVWRESPDVATNHDLCYARSLDGGTTWERSDGTQYELPIRAADAEVVVRVPQRQELINTTSMCVDPSGRPCIATYWRPADQDVPQYFVVRRDDAGWRTYPLSRRTTPFRLGGSGSRRAPIARPQIASCESFTVVVFRDVERGDRASAAWSEDLEHWRVVDLTAEPLGRWEPTFDLERWRSDREMHLFLQTVEREEHPTTEVAVLEWAPLRPLDVTSETLADPDALGRLQAPGDVLFDDDFEDATALTERYFEVRGLREGHVVVDDEGRGGGRALRCTAPDRNGASSGAGASCWLGPEGHTRVHLRRYVRFADDYDQGNLNHTGGGLAGIAGRGKWDGMGKAGLRPEGDDRFTCRFEPWRDWGREASPGYLFLYTYWCDMRAGRDGHYWGNMLEPPKAQRVVPVRGEWVCLEQMIQVNSFDEDGARADGELAAWVDGELYLHMKGIRWRTDASVRIKRFNLDVYVHAAVQDNTAWYDDVVVSSGYIGR